MKIRDNLFHDPDPEVRSQWYRELYKDFEKVTGISLVHHDSRRLSLGDGHATMDQGVLRTFFDAAIRGRQVTAREKILTDALEKLKNQTGPMIGNSKMSSGLVYNISRTALEQAAKEGPSERDGMKESSGGKGSGGASRSRGNRTPKEATMEGDMNPDRRPDGSRDFP